MKSDLPPSKSCLRGVTSLDFDSKKDRVIFLETFGFMKIPDLTSKFEFSVHLYHEFGIHGVVLSMSVSSSNQSNTTEDTQSVFSWHED